MSKKLFSLLTVLFVVATAFATFVIVKKDGTLVHINVDQLKFEQKGSSFILNGTDVQDVAYIYNKVWDSTDDYERAFTEGYLDSKYYTYDRKKQITSQEFKTMLKPLIEKYQADSMNYFNSHIADYDVPISRGVAAGMAYYTARSIGAETRNKTIFLNEIDDFWDGIGDSGVDKVLPYFAETGVENAPQEVWWRVFGGLMSAYMWNSEHMSVVSQKEVIEFDSEAYSFHWQDAFTWEDAVRAITRLYDSFYPEIVYASIDDPRVTSPDASVITPELIALAAKNEIHDIENLPRQIGFFCGEGNTDIDYMWHFATTPKEISEWASWGFNSLRYQISWRYLFDNDLNANLTLFKSLDEMIATAMENGMHINLSMAAMPGCGAYWAENIRDDYIMDNDIMNSEKRKKACEIWKTIATRYKDIPNANLSFQPISEYLGLYNPDGFGEGQAFTLEQIDDYHDVLIDAIREVSPERFIFYTSLFMPSKTQSGFDGTLGIEQYQHFSKKYKNIRPVCGLMDMAYMFYSYNTGDGNIDWANHSVWVPTYPTTIYGGNGLIHDNNILTIDGCLPKGTTIDFYIADAANAIMNVAADGNTLYEEVLNGDFNMGYAMAFGEPFKKSDKKVTLTLEADAGEVVLSANGGSLNWCGIEVKLPESYTVKKWRKISEWDKETGLVGPEFKDVYIYQASTSSVQIGSTVNDWEGGSLRVTVNDDVTYTTDYIFSYSNKELTEKIVKENCESLPKWTCAFEDILITDMAGALNYWDETMEIYQRYGVDVWISAIGLLSEEQLAPFRIADYEGEDFNGHHNFNVKLLKILQKYVDK